mgnify:CR=1 FL=1
MTNVTEPMWESAPEGLVATVTRPADGWVLTGEMFMEDESFVLITAFGAPDAKSRTTVITRNLRSDEEARQEFLVQAEAFLSDNRGN